MGQYLTAVGIILENELSCIRKKKDAPLHPIFEAITNSFEAIEDWFGDENLHHGRIEIEFVVTKNLQMNPPLFDFGRINIRDNGIGLDNEGFERLKNLRDTAKGKNNKGTGRVQFIHSFKETIIDSQCKDLAVGLFRHRKVTLSKGEVFRLNNAILRIDADEEGRNDGANETVVTFQNPWDKKEMKYFAEISVPCLKKEIIRHFLGFFCNNRERLPQISIKRIVDGEEECCESIQERDIPKPFKENDVEVRYCNKNESDAIVDLDRIETFRLRGFKLPANELMKNEILMVSKGASGDNLKLQDVAPTDVVDANRYLFLLSGNYFEVHDSDARGTFDLMTEREFKEKERTMLDEPVILINRLESATNEKIRESFPEIAKKKEERDSEVDRLADMFLLNKETVNSLRGNFKNTDTAEQILRKVYEADSRIAAQKDAEIKQILDDLNSLDPASGTYRVQLEEKSKKLSTIIPLRNRSALAQYIARRKLVLEMFEKILARELASFEKTGRVNEDVLHNLIFEQHSTNPETSDLWIINEEFVYFDGASEKELLKIMYKGKNIIRDSFSEKERKYLDSNKEKRLSKRPDILLFPSEGKCVFIEFKAPDVNVSKHLSQIDFYATMLYNFTKSEFKFTQFYGYLVGEGIEPWDVRAHDSRYVEAPGFDYLYRATHPVAKLEGGADGSLYSEVLTYSALLKRAIARNKMFIDKLGLGNSL